MWQLHQVLLFSLWYQILALSKLEAIVHSCRWIIPELFSWLYSGTADSFWFQGIYSVEDSLAFCVNKMPNSDGVLSILIFLLYPPIYKFFNLCFVCLFWFGLEDRFSWLLKKIVLVFFLTLADDTFWTAFVSWVTFEISEYSTVSNISGELGWRILFRFWYCPLRNSVPS